MDQLSIFRTIIVNAVKAKHTSAIVNGTKLNKVMLDVMKDQGYITEYTEVKGTKHKKFRVRFKIVKRGEFYKYAIKDMKQVSRPGLRVYKPYKELFFVQNGKGSSIISTSKGVKEGHDARKMHLGGEVLLNIYSY